MLKPERICFGAALAAAGLARCFPITTSAHWAWCWASAISALPLGRHCRHRLDNIPEGALHRPAL